MHGLERNINTVYAEASCNYSMERLFFFLAICFKSTFTCFLIRNDSNDSRADSNDIYMESKICFKRFQLIRFARSKNKKSFSFKKILIQNC